MLGRLFRRSRWSTACAAVSSLVRTAARLVAERPALRVQGSAPSAGEIAFELQPIEGLAETERLWLAGVTEFLVGGLRDVATDYPRELLLKIETKTGR